MSTQPIHYKHGTSEALDFPALSITKRRKFVDLLVEGKSPEIVALCADRNLAWIDSLTDDCYNSLVKVCIQQNFKKATEMVMNDPVAFLKMGPMILQLQEVSRSLGLTDSLPTPASSSPTGNASPQTPPPAVAAPATPAPSAT